MSKGRRSNGEGTLRLRADGRWECTLMDGYDNDGRRVLKSFYGKSQKQVKEKLKRYLADKEAGIDTAGGETPFSDWADFWFEGHKDNISPTTQENYRYTLRILTGYFGRRHLNSIKPYDIEAFMRKLRNDGRSDSYLAKCKALMFQIMNKAEGNDLIRKNPVRFAEKLRRLPHKKGKDSFTAEEVQKMFDELPENRIGWCIRLMLGTGMRTQELLALEPRNIAEDGSLIQIRQAINMDKGKAKIGTPKSEDSYRDVPVPENVRYCARLLREGAGTYIWDGKMPGTPVNPSTFRHNYTKALQSLETVRVLSPHSCRHTYVSQMQALGVDLDTIKSIVGHADIDMTQHYLHVQQPIRQDAIDRFAKAFGGKNPETEPPEPPESGKIIALPIAFSAYNVGG